MNQLHGKQIQSDSIALDKLTGGEKFFTTGTMSFGADFNLTINSDSILRNDSVVNKEYVDSVAQGLEVKDSVTIRIKDETVNLTGLQTIQGVTLEDGDRVLVNSYPQGSASATDNNIFIVRSGAWEIAPDAIVGDTLSSGSFVFIEEGDYANGGYVLTTTEAELSLTNPSLNWIIFTHVDLVDTGVIPDTYGSSASNFVPTFEVDSKGRLISASSYELKLLLGQPENGTYTDGLYKDFTNDTLIGTAIDRINETLLLLAPPQPRNWDNTLQILAFEENPKTARQLGTGNVINNLYTDNEPVVTSTSNISILGSENVGTEEEARIAQGTFELIDNGVSLEQITLNGDATQAKTSGFLRHSAAVDPYDGISGKAGFWKGIVSFEVGGSIELDGDVIIPLLSPYVTLPLISASETERVLTLTHPGNTSPTTLNYYIDDPLFVRIENISATFPAMTNFISGIPSVNVGDNITNISFEIVNVSSYFYSSNDVWEIIEGIVNRVTGDPDVIPTTYGSTGVASNINASIRNNQFDDGFINFAVVGRNSVGSYGLGRNFGTDSYRVDTVSDESNRLTSGSGNYPTTGYGNAYDSTQSLLFGAYVNELMLKNGEYQYPNGNYTRFNIGDYNTATGTRFATFNIGTFNANSSFVLNINDSTGISSVVDNSDMFVEVKIGTSSSWVDADSPYSGVGSPGSTSDGDGAVALSSSTPTQRRITFGSVVHSGDIIVRIGFTSGSTKKFKSITATNLE